MKCIISNLQSSKSSNLEDREIKYLWNKKQIKLKLNIFHFFY
jgi:hypothetical protein